MVSIIPGIGNWQAILDDLDSNLCAECTYDEGALTSLCRECFDANQAEQDYDHDKGN